MKILIPFFLLLIALVGCSEESHDFDSMAKAGREAYISGNYRIARDYFFKALNQNASDQEVLYLLGVIYQKEYMYDSSLFYLKKVDILYPRQKEINKTIYQVAPYALDWKSAIKAIEVLIKTGESKEKYYEDLAEYNLRAERYFHALYYNKKLLANDSGNIKRYLQVANTAAVAESLDVAVETIDYALEKFGPIDELVSNQGTLYAFQKKFAKAEKNFRKLFLKDTTNIYHKLNLASVLSELDEESKKKEAYLLLNEIKQLQPSPTIDSMILELKTDLNLD